MNERRACAICALVPLILWLACWPFVDCSVNDDFSYAFTVKRLLETGQFTYNGWSTAFLGAQAYWGAAFSWCLGFSHNVLRLSTLPLAMGCGVLTYCLHRRFEIARSWSVLGTLLLVASPLFIPWSASFMTDVPGLFFTLLVAHSAVSLTLAARTRDVIIWCVAMLAAGLIGASVRQTVGGMAAAALLVECVRHRRDLIRLAFLGASLLILIASLYGMFRWQAAQPYAIADLLRPSWTVSNLLGSFGKLTLDGFLFTLPLWIALAYAVPISRRMIAIIVCIVGAVAVALVLLVSPLRIDLFAAPWTGNTITRAGLTNDVHDAPGIRPIIIPDSTSMVVGAVTWIVGLGVIGHVARGFLTTRSDRVVADRSTVLALRSIIVLCLAYLALLLPRASERDVFDRYLLVLIPLASVLILARLRPVTSVRWPAWALLAIATGVGWGMTFDHFSELRARVRMVDELMGHGAKRDQILAGLNIDVWIQLEQRGHVNDTRIRNPPDAYQPPNPERLRSMYWTTSLAPVIDPHWEILNVTNESVHSTAKIRRSFRAILPPQARWIVAVPLVPLKEAESSRTAPEEHPD